ncbi:unnamed protein product [Dovyalis caffra]|uniref:Uncharacterized protein n=1 Tax=Dovyalis caffra TaxID=77055 RepID=A0AAV1SIT3_9ROSI|nr:unnamed protein product [Dovyalis caffra]
MEPQNFKIFTSTAKTLLQLLLICLLQQITTAKLIDQEIIWYPKDEGRDAAKTLSIKPFTPHDAFMFDPRSILDDHDLMVSHSKESLSFDENLRLWKSQGTLMQKSKKKSPHFSQDVVSKADRKREKKVWFYNGPPSHIASSSLSNLRFLYKYFEND